MGRLVENVYVDGVWYGPSYSDAGEPPRGSVSNPAAWDEPPDNDDTRDEGVSDEEDETPSSGEPPPKAGPGSARSKWATYAAAREVKVNQDDSREDIIAACKRAGVPTED